MLFPKLLARNPQDKHCFAVIVCSVVLLRSIISPVQTLRQRQALFS